MVIKVVLRTDGNRFYIGSWQIGLVLSHGPKQIPFRLTLEQKSLWAIVQASVSECQALTTWLRLKNQNDRLKAVVTVMR